MPEGPEVDTDKLREQIDEEIEREDHSPVAPPATPGSAVLDGIAAVRHMIIASSPVSW